jgi:quinoprotein glucose dehydrogenase
MKIDAALALLLTASAISGQDWPHWGGDLGGMKFSALKQIHKGNVSKLRQVWVFDTQDFSDGTQLATKSAFEATPLVIENTMYLISPFGRVFALDAETGTEKWVFDPKIDKTVRVNLFANRGLASWNKGGQRRLFAGDLEGRLHSIDARTGKLDPAFGQKGSVDLARDAQQGEGGAYRLSSPVAVCGDVLIAGGWVNDGNPRGPSGDIRGLDARDGRLLWRFHTVPRPGEAGHETWSENSWKERGGTNSWSISSVDSERGLVFIPLTSPSYDFYGGDRKGANLYSDSVVALKCATGQRAWHYQTVHHDLWDYDLASPPALITAYANGKARPAVAQATKQGFLFVLDRDTGKPIFPVEERPVPPSKLPGEQASPTQPFPTRTPAFSRQSMTASEITNTTPESRAECLAMTEGVEFGRPLFQPLDETPAVLFPGLNGGANWGGVAFDPKSQLLFVNSMDVGGLFRLVDRGEEAEIRYRLRALKYEFFWDSKMYPCQRPPWGHLTAIDMKTGEFRWRVVLGEFDELTQKGVPKTGAPNLGGPIVTAGGLVFIGATNDGKFRAFDRDTGHELWMARLPASGMATPVTYRGAKTGRQFVAIAAGGGNKYDKKFSGKIVVFSLP